MKKSVELFMKYVSKYNTEDHMIDYKIGHSIRDMKGAEKLARKLGFSERDVEIASLCGLLHDIGRFGQFEKYKTYHDHKSLDHGDFGYLVLQDEIDKYTDDKRVQDIVMAVTKHHNKIEFPALKNEEHIKFLHLLKDADKIDILYSYVNELINLPLKENYLTIDELNNIYNMKLIDKSKEIIPASHFIRGLCFLYDMYHVCAFEEIRKLNIVNDAFDMVLEKNKNMAFEIEKARKFLLDYVDSKTKKR